MGVTYVCTFCNYETDHKAKYTRHVHTVKHQIAEHGVECCGLRYYEKHKWVNHKKSVKHHLRVKETGEDPEPVFEFSNTPIPPEERETLNLTLKNELNESNESNESDKLEGSKIELKTQAETEEE